MKVALFAFNGEPMCFVHVLLNALDMKERGYEVAIVIEGSATKLIRDFYDDPTIPFASLYQRARNEGLIRGVCKACATKMGSKESAEAQGLELMGEVSGHPSIAAFLEEGFQVLTF